MTLVGRRAVPGVADVANQAVVLYLPCRIGGNVAPLAQEFGFGYGTLDHTFLGDTDGCVPGL